MLDTLVTVDLDNHSLKECLSRLTEKYGINFSYINDEIPLQKQIHFTRRNQALKVVLDSICKQADIRYFLVGTQIVLKKAEQVNVSVLDSASVIPVTVLQTSVVLDTTIQASNTTTEDSYYMNKKYKKYFFSVFGKRRLPDSMIVVSSDGVTDTVGISEQTKKYRYVNRTYVHSRFSIGLFGGVGTAYRTLSGDARFVSERNADEQNVSNYVVGVHVTYYIESLNVSFRSGLNYMTFGEKGTFKEIIFIQPQQGGGGGPPQGPTEKTILHAYQNQYTYLILPLMIGYNFHGKSRLGASVYSGISLAFLLSNRSTYVESSNDDNQQQNSRSRNPYLHTYRNINVVLPVALEVSYRVTSKIHMFVAPTFNYFLSSIYTASDRNKEKPYAINFSIGLNYFFKSNKFLLK